MIRAFSIAIAAALLVGACTEMQLAVDRTARQSAKGIVAETLATRFPAVPKELITQFTDCVIDNASAAEIGEFAKDTVVGADNNTVALVRGIIARPETIQCLGATSFTPGLIV